MEKRTNTGWTKVNKKALALDRKTFQVSFETKTFVSGFRRKRRRCERNVSPSPRKKHIKPYTKMGWRLKMKLLWSEWEKRLGKEKLVNVTSNTKSESLLGVWEAHSTAREVWGLLANCSRMMEWNPPTTIKLFEVSERETDEKFHRWLSPRLDLFSVMTNKDHKSCKYLQKH